MARPKRGETRAPKPNLKDKIPEIITRMIEGESLRSICRSDGMPAVSTFFVWVSQDTELEKQYSAAIQLRADVYFEQMMDIADTPIEGEKTKTIDGPDGQKIEVTTGDMIDHRKLQVDARKWALARMNPKKYGEKVDLNHGGRVKVIPLDRDDEAI
jgi:hypothetical protein